VIVGDEGAPSTTAAPCEVFPHDPAFPLAAMPLQCPLPQGLEARPPAGTT
jgi:hypothetical protein